MWRRAGCRTAPWGNGGTRRPGSWCVGRRRGGRRGRRSGHGGRPHGEPPLALVVVAPRDGLAVHAPDPVVAETWMSSRTPHLYAGVIEATGVVGPLVLPGGSACAGCLALERADRDPGWPRLLAQWRSGRGATGAQACDVGLAATVAGLAAAHALSFLDGELPATTGARWEVSLPQLDWRSRRTAPHPECPCGAAGRREGERLAEALPQHDTMTG